MFRSAVKRAKDPPVRGSGRHTYLPARKFDPYPTLDLSACLGVEHREVPPARYPITAQVVTPDRKFLKQESL